MYVALRVGRLVEIRSVGALTEADMARFQTEMLQLAPRLAKIDRVIGVTDGRFARAAPLPVVEQIKLFMRLGGARLEREAMILGADKVQVMQARRIAEEVPHPGRKLVTSVAEAIAWLEPVATREELARARQFLAEAPAPPR